MRKRIYVAATSQHIGKTTSTLGLVQALRNQGVNVGYCKPVGQQGVLIDNKIVDKDTELFAQLLGFNLRQEIHSPVILGAGATQDFLDNPEAYPFEEMILNAAKVLDNEHDMVIYEGTGHPGVGAVVDLSNADVAHLLGAEVILVVEGGIGNTIDRLKLSMTMFKDKNVPIIGVIINKVRPEKYDKIKYYVGKKLAEWNIPLIGVIPYDKTLLYPLFDTVRKAVDGRVLYNEENMFVGIENTVAASLIDTFDFNTRQNTLLVVSTNRFPEALAKIEKIYENLHLAKHPLAGIIITGDGRNEESMQTFACEAIFMKHKIPVVTTMLDTYGAAVKISRMEVKINTLTPWKTQRAIQLVEEYVDLGFL